MKKRFEKKTVLVLILSLLLAGRYVEYGKKVKASETEETTEKSTEALTEKVTEKSTEEMTEKTTEKSTEALTEKVTEKSTEEATEKTTEKSTEETTEKGTEKSTEEITEKVTERMTEEVTERLTEEPETEAAIKILQITNIRVAESEKEKIYDGTDQIHLSYDVSLSERKEHRLQDEGALQEEREEILGELPQIACTAHLTGSDVGEWEVEYQFRLPDGEEGYQLEVEETALTAKILPRELTVVIPDGWKSYGSEGEMENVHLLGEVQVDGFLKDEKERDIIPEGFELPEITLDSSVIDPWSDIYENGTQKIYRDALVMRRNKKGKLTGNPTKNYIFSQDDASGKYRTGSLVITQSGVILGKDYELRGEEGNCYQKEDGTVWIRRGTKLGAYPLEHSGYNLGAETDGLQQNGSFSFSLKKKNKAGEITADSLEETVEFWVDGEVPEALISVENAGEEKGVLYGREGVSVAIRIPEDSESGMKRARYFVAVSKELFGDWSQTGEEWWQDCLEGTRLELTRNGTYVVYVETEDNVGNRAWAKSGQIVVDTEAPELVISGAENNSANAGSVFLTVSCSDSNYREGSLQVELSPANGGSIPMQIGKEENREGAELSFADFPYDKRADDIYTLRAAAEDLAGNLTEEQITFSVNRFGSVYDLSEETRHALKQYYHREAFPVVFLETNIDYVGNVKILCREDGVLRELIKDRDYTVGRSGDDNTWKRYCYTIAPEVFEEEGTYEAILLSTDRAKNSADSQTQAKEVRFAIDRTPPECLITGLEKEQVYHTKEVWACLEPRDNGSLKEMRLYLDGQQIFSCDGEAIRQKGGIVKWKAEAKTFWQRLQVYVADEAGNTFWTEELPFFITEKKEKVAPYVKTGKSARELEEQKQFEEKDITGGIVPKQPFVRRILLLLIALSVLFSAVVILGFHWAGHRIRSAGRKR